jgi:hypothetical protein
MSLGISQRAAALFLVLSVVAASFGAVRAYFTGGVSAEMNVVVGPWPTSTASPTGAAPAIEPTLEPTPAPAAAQEPAEPAPTADVTLGPPTETLTPDPSAAP